jgi:hypothetical protein
MGDSARAARPTITPSWEEKREAERLSIDLPARVLRSQLRSDAATVTNLSLWGCRVVSSSAGPGEAMSIKLDRLEPLRAQVVWRSGTAIGCRFERPLHSAVLKHIVRKV